MAAQALRHAQGQGAWPAARGKLGQSGGGEGGNLGFPWASKVGLVQPDSLGGRNQTFIGSLPAAPANSNNYLVRPDETAISVSQKRIDY